MADKRGRPTKYTEEIATEVCARLAQGDALRDICSVEGMPAEGTHAIYALCDPDTGDIRYIGQTTNPERRFGQHCRQHYTHSPTHRAAWLESLRKAGSQPQMHVLEWTDEWDAAERFWVSVAKNAGCVLVNGDEGGCNMTHVQLARLCGEWRGKWTPLQRIRNSLKQTVRLLRKCGDEDKARDVERQIDRVNEVASGLEKKLGKREAVTYINRTLAKRHPHIFGVPA